jgi:hypothetical protein
MSRPGLHFWARDPDTAAVSSPDPEVPVPLNRTTIRALAASVAMLAAGGTVAAAAVFHIPVLGFGAASAGASANRIEQAAAVRPAKPVAPIRVVKTRYVDQIVHHQMAAPAAFAPTAPPATAAPAPMAARATAVTTAPVTAPPVTQPPAAPYPGGDDGHESGDGPESGHGGHGGGDAVPSGTGQSTSGTGQ